MEMDAQFHSHFMDKFDIVALESPLRHLQAPKVLKGKGP
jgi:hypothetical protein